MARECVLLDCLGKEFNHLLRMKQKPFILVTVTNLYYSANFLF